MTQQDNKRTKVFISYSHNDVEWLGRLRVHLKPLERDFDIDVWDDTRIKPGSKWNEEIKNAIELAKIAVLLISADFLASEFISSDELPPLLKAAEEEGTVILPLILSPSRFSSINSISQFQSVNSPSKPLINLPRGEQEEILVELSEHIETLLISSSQGKPQSDKLYESSISNQPAKISNNRQSPFERYEIIHPIYQGHYSHVFKCRVIDSGEICIIKETDAKQVSLKTLKALQDLEHPNIAIPNNVWEHDGKIYEELPYVGGVRLSSAIQAGIGGLSGCVLESFHDQLLEILRKLHEKEIVHRDIHPDNIYLVISREEIPYSTDKRSFFDRWEYDIFSFERYPTNYGSSVFFLAWVLVDCTFATLLSEKEQKRCRHGVYTPEEQEIGEVSPASDMYAFGATLYYGITGHEIPSFQTRKKYPESLDFYPDGEHPSVNFSAYLEKLLSLDPTERPTGNYYLSQSSIVNGYTGTLQISDNLFLITDRFPGETRLLTRKEALDFFHERRNFLETNKRWFNNFEETMKEVEFWINKLKDQ